MKLIIASFWSLVITFPFLQGDVCLILGSMWLIVGHSVFEFVHCHLGGGHNVWRAFWWQPCGTSSFSVLKSPAVAQVLFSSDCWLLKNKSKISALSFIWAIIDWRKYWELFHFFSICCSQIHEKQLFLHISAVWLFASMQHRWGVEFQKWAILATLVCCSLLLPRQIKQINHMRDRGNKSEVYMLQHFSLGIHALLLVSSENPRRTPFMY